MQITAMDRIVERNIEPMDPQIREEARSILVLFSSDARAFPPPIYPDAGLSEADENPPR